MMDALWRDRDQAVRSLAVLARGVLARLGEAPWLLLIPLGLLILPQLVPPAKESFPLVQGIIRLLIVMSLTAFLMTAWLREGRAELDHFVVSGCLLVMLNAPVLVYMLGSSQLAVLLVLRGLTEQGLTVYEFVHFGVARCLVLAVSACAAVSLAQWRPGLSALDCLIQGARVARANAAFFILLVAGVIAAESALGWALTLFAVASGFDADQLRPIVFLEELLVAQLKALAIVLPLEAGKKGLLARA